MKNLHSQTALLLLFIITAANLLSPCLGTLSEIQKICSNTTEYEYTTCEFVLQRNLIWPMTDFAGLTRITTGETLGFATNTLKYIQNAMLDEGDPSVSSGYGMCEKYYAEAVRYLTRADYYAQKGNYKSMVSQLDKARTKVSACFLDISFLGGVLDLTEFYDRMSLLIKMGLYEGRCVEMTITRKAEVKVGLIFRKTIMLCYPVQVVYSRLQDTMTSQLHVAALLLIIPANYLIFWD